MKSESHSVVSDSIVMDYIYSPWNSPGQNTGVGSLSLLRQIFPTQGLNPGLPHCRQLLYQLSHKGSPRILEWVACPFSSGSSWPRNQTGVSCIAGGYFFTNWAIGESCRFSVIYFSSSRCIFCFFKCIYFTAVTLLWTLNKEIEIKKKRKEWHPCWSSAHPVQ